MRALAKDPERRYETAAEMREALVACRSAIEAAGAGLSTRTLTGKVDVVAATVAASSGGVLTTDVNWVVESRRKQAQTPLALAGLALVGLVVWAVTAEDGGPDPSPVGLSRPALVAAPPAKPPPSRAPEIPPSSLEGVPKAEGAQRPKDEEPRGKADAGQAAATRVAPEAKVPDAKRRGAPGRRPPAGKARLAAASPGSSPARSAPVAKRVSKKGPKPVARTANQNGAKSGEGETRPAASVTTEVMDSATASKAALAEALESALRRCRCGPARKVLKKMASYPSLAKEWTPRVARCRPPLPDFGCRYTP